MQKLFYFLAPVFLSLAFFSCSSGWQRYNSSEFTVDFPGKAKDTVTVENNFTGAKVFYEPAQLGLDSNMYYAVSVYSLPDSVSVLGNKIYDFMRTDVNIYAWSMGATTADSGRVVKSGPYEGREYKVILPQNTGIATVRKFSKGKHLYTLLVITDNAHLNNDAIEKFMNSFRLK